MKRVKAIVERASDGSYSIYTDDDGLDYLITGTGQTVEEAMRCFEGGYEDMRRLYAEEGRPFEEIETDYKFDTASFLAYFTKAFTLSGLSRITGINQGQLSHYITGRRTPSEKTKRRMQDSIHAFAEDLQSVSFV